MISVLSVHHLTDEQKRTPVPARPRAVPGPGVGDVVKAEPQVTPIDPAIDFPDSAAELAEWCGGEVAWKRRRPGGRPRHLREGGHRTGLPSHRS